MQNLSPGLVNTEFFDANNLDKNSLKGHKALNPEDIANSIIHIIGAPQHVHISELIIKPFGEKFV